MKKVWTSFLAAWAALVILSCVGGGRPAREGEKPSAPRFGSSYEVIVIGAGGAGLSAAVAARDAGARVVIFEKMGNPGGATLQALGGINASGTSFQEKAGIRDSPDLLYADTMTRGYNRNDPALVRNLAVKSASSAAWLAGMGADLSQVDRLPGAAAARAHNPKGGGKVGEAMVNALINQAGKAGIPIFTDCRVTKILMEDGGASGVEFVYRNETYHVKAALGVVLATGGFSANNGMCAELVPALRGFAATGPSGSTGDGIALAEEAGAALRDMTAIQIHPTYAPDQGIIPEEVRERGAILVNKLGARFTNELRSPESVAAAIIAQDGGTSFLVFDQGVRKSLPIVDDYLEAGIAMEGDTLEALAARIGVNPRTLSTTIVSYNQAVEARNDAAFRRTHLPRSLSAAPYYAILVTPASHYTMGGVRIDKDARVISTQGNVIPGLYAAGEVTGGIHGGAPLEGNPLADAVTYGRIAGTNAAHR